MNGEKGRKAELLKFAALKKEKESAAAAVFSGEKPGAAAVVTCKMSAAAAEAVSKKLSEVVNGFENSSFVCETDPEGNVRFSLCGSAAFAARALAAISEEEK